MGALTSAGALFSIRAVLPRVLQEEISFPIFCYVSSMPIEERVLFPRYGLSPHPNKTLLSEGTRSQ